MKNKKVICPNCHKFVDYEVKDEFNMALIKASEITFKKKVAYCKECHNPVWVDWIDDYNANKPYVMYGIINEDVEMLDRILNHFGNEIWFNQLIKDVGKEIGGINMKHSENKYVDDRTYPSVALETIKEIKKKGLTDEENKKILYNAGIIDKDGNVVEAYKNIIYLKNRRGS